MKQSQSSKLLEGSVGITLVKMTWSMFWGILAITSFQVADAFFVGKLGTEALAGLSFTFPVAMFLVNLAIGMGIGTTAVISRAVGSGEWEYVNRLGTYALSLSLFVGVCVMALGLLTIDPLFSAMGALDHHMPAIRDYMTIWYLGLPAVIVTIVANFSMRALGETKIPGLLMVGSSVMNIVLDPLLIFGWGPFPGMGVLGAALASVIADMVFVVLSFWVLLKRLHLFTLKGLRVQEGVMAIQSFIKIGFPASLANMIVPFSIGVVTYLVASYGEAAVAAFGVVTRVETFFLVLPLALSSVLGPFVGQHVGAERYDRIHEALRLVFRFCLLWGLLLAVILFFLSSIIMEAFNSDPNVVRQGRFYFWIVPISYMGYSIVMNVSAAFNAFGRPKPTLILSLLRMVVLYLPLAYFLQQFWGLVGIFVAASFANMISGCVAYYWNRVHCSGSS